MTTRSLFPPWSAGGCALEPVFLPLFLGAWGVLFPLFASLAVLPLLPFVAALLALGDVFCLADLPVFGALTDIAVGLAFSIV
ncbi:MAG: hypothetical protein RBR22_01665 [Desulfuromonas sp.]|nr:hypothetical protein [Desulfuromonas sp.]